MPKFNVRRAVVSAGLAGALAFSGTAVAFATEDVQGPVDPETRSEANEVANITIVSVDPTTNEQSSMTIPLPVGTKFSDPSALAPWLIPGEYAGYEFVGWQDSRTDDVMPTTQVLSQVAAGDVTFTPIYQKQSETPDPKPDPVQQVSVKFVLTDTDGVQQGDAQEVVFAQGDKITNVPEPANYDGYEFVGWTDSRTGTTVKTEDIKGMLATSDVTFTTVYQKKAETPDPTPKPESVNVTLNQVDPQGQLVASKTLNFEYGDKMEALDAWLEPADYDGYEFVGWTDSRTGTPVTTEDIKGMLATSDVTFTTVYQKKAETPKPDPEAAINVTLVKVDPTTGEESSQVFGYKSGDSLDTLAEFLNHQDYDGYDFLGWKDSRLGDVLPATEITTQLASSDVTFTTVYQKKAETPDPTPEVKFSIFFDMTDPATGEVTDSLEVAYGDTGLVDNIPDLGDQDGYKFVGWKGEDGTVYSADELSRVVVSSETHFTTVWEKNETPAEKATVKFIMTDPETDEIIFEKSVETTAGSKVALTELAGLPSVDGYSLDSWVDQNGASYEASLGDFTAPAGNTTMLAQLTKNATPDPIEKATVKFIVTNPETDEILFDQSVDTTEGAAVALPAGLPALDGYSLDHWVDQNGASYQASLSDFVAPAGDTTLLAQWTKNATPDPITKVNVTFIATEPGTDTVAYDSTVEAVSGDAVTAPADMAGLFEGYALTGFVDKAGNTYGADLAGYVAPKTDDILYAQYEKEADPIEWAKATFLDADGSVIGTADYQVNETMGFWAVIPGQREDAKFRGYAIQDKESDGVVDPNAITMSKDGMTFVAVWEKNAEPEQPVDPETKTYTVTFDTDGGSAVDAQKVEDGKTAAKPADPTKDGFTFAGWTLDGKPYDFEQLVKSDITLKATWKAVEGGTTTDPSEKPGEGDKPEQGDNNKPADKNDGKDNGKKDESQKKDQLPKTGDDTNVAGLAAAGAAGVAALGAGAVLLNRRKREQN